MRFYFILESQFLYNFVPQIAHTSAASYGKSVRWTFVQHTLNKYPWLNKKKNNQIIQEQSVLIYAYIEILDDWRNMLCV